jgi:hypothetical protein
MGVGVTGWQGVGVLFVATPHHRERSEHPRRHHERSE